jgi:uncharacterized protein
VGLHHWRNGNFHGASTLLDEGIERLRPFLPSCQTVDVARLIGDATDARERLEELGEASMHAVDVVALAPQIRFTR